MGGTLGSVNVMLPKVVTGDLLHSARRGRSEEPQSEKHRRGMIEQIIMQKKRKISWQQAKNQKTSSPPPTKKGRWPGLQRHNGFQLTAEGDAEDKRI